MFGPEEEAFNNNIHEITFPWNDHEEPSNPGVLDDNVRWLKDHANDRFLACFACSLVRLTILTQIAIINRMPHLTTS